TIDQDLGAATSRLTSIHAPRVSQPPVIMNRDFTRLQKTVTHSQAITTTMQAGSARIRYGFERLYSQWIVALQELIGYVRERRPQGMTIRAISTWPPRNTTKTDLVELVPLPFAVVTRIHDMGAVGKTCRIQKFGVPLPEQTADHVENTPQGVISTGQCGRVPGPEQ